MRAQVAGRLRHSSFALLFYFGCICLHRGVDSRRFGNGNCRRNRRCSVRGRGGGDRNGGLGLNLNRFDGSYGRSRNCWLGYWCRGNGRWAGGRWCGGRCRRSRDHHCGWRWRGRLYNRRGRCWSCCWRRGDYRCSTDGRRGDRWCGRRGNGWSARQRRCTSGWCARRRGRCFCACNWLRVSTGLGVNVSRRQKREPANRGRAKRSQKSKIHKTTMCTTLWGQCAARALCYFLEQNACRLRVQAAARPPDTCQVALRCQTVNTAPRCTA